MPFYIAVYGPERRLVFDQSSLVHPISESRGGSTSVTEDGWNRTEMLMSNIGGLISIQTPCKKYTKLPKDTEEVSKADKKNQKQHCM